MSKMLFRITCALGVATGALVLAPQASAQQTACHEDLNPYDWVPGTNLPSDHDNCDEVGNPNEGGDGSGYGGWMTPPAPTPPPPPPPPPPAPGGGQLALLARDPSQTQV